MRKIKKPKGSKLAPWLTVTAMVALMFWAMSSSAGTSVPYGDSFSSSLFPPGESIGGAQFGSEDSVAETMPPAEAPDYTEVKVVVTDYAQPCTFGYENADEPYTSGCVARSKMPVGPKGVWGVACRLGNCYRFGDLCVFLPRPRGWGDLMLLPAEVEDYRALPPRTKARAC